MGSLNLGPGTRLMVLAPHPDDDVLAAGGLLQRARAVGADVRVVFVTNGENNPWPQRVLERRWRIGPSDRARFGRHRKAEALAALQTLGIHAVGTVFLGFPDQGITGRLLAGGRDITAAIAAEVAQWRPTLIAAPGCGDLHPDHSALAVLTGLAVDSLPQDRGSIRRVEYLVHTLRPKAPPAASISLPLSPEQRNVKLRAILCHASQLKLRPFSVTARAAESEEFGDPECPASACGHHPVRESSVENGALHFELALRPRLGAFGRATVCLVGWNQSEMRAWLVPLPHVGAWLPRSVEVISAATGLQIGQGSYVGGWTRGRLVVPLAALMPAQRLFVKLERRFGFFDEAGWREVPQAGI